MLLWNCALFVQISLSEAVEGWVEFDGRRAVVQAQRVQVCQVVAVDLMARGCVTASVG